MRLRESREVVGCELQKQRRDEYARQNKKRKRPPSGTKRCSRCEQELPYSEFRKAADRKDGHYEYCKACESDYRKERNE